MTSAVVSYRNWYDYWFVFGQRAVDDSR